MLKTAVIGIGNEIMGDDSIGPHIARILFEKKVLPDDVLIIDEGRGGMRFIHHIKDQDRVIIIDAADISMEPGDVIVFRPEEVESIKDLSGTNIHEWDLLKMLELSKILGECPEDIQIVAIQPRSMKFGDALSLELLKKEDVYVQKVVELVKGP